MFDSAKFEHWIDQAIWILADLDPRKGTCITSQVGSIHGKFRALLALMEDAKRPKLAIDAANQLSAKAANVVNVRNRFANNLCGRMSSTRTAKQARQTSQRRHELGSEHDRSENSCNSTTRGVPDHC